MIRPLGFGMAVGVLFDAFVVRLLLMPALMHLLGRAAWWMPRWLDRLLPNVDVEGASLERDAAAHAAIGAHHVAGGARKPAGRASGTGAGAGKVPAGR
jgi:RND superfamily putative drug exporter